MVGFCPRLQFAHMERETFCCVPPTNMEKLQQAEIPMPKSEIYTGM